MRAFFGGMDCFSDRRAFAREEPPGEWVELLCSLNPGETGLITGASGSGKSTLLQAVGSRLTDTLGVKALSLSAVRLAERRRVVDLFGETALAEIIGSLARVGLAEAGILLRTPGELSDGQRYRLRLCLALPLARRRGAVLLCDEFTSLLDDVTAAVIARSLARSVRRLGLRAVVATWRGTLAEELEPRVHVHCDFGRWIRRPPPLPSPGPAQRDQ